MRDDRAVGIEVDRPLSACGPSVESKARPEHALPAGRQAMNRIRSRPAVEANVHMTDSYPCSEVAEALRVPINQTSL